MDHAEVALCRPIRIVSLGIASVLDRVLDLVATARFPSCPKTRLIQSDLRRPWCFEGRLRIRVDESGFLLGELVRIQDAKVTHIE